jgi:hypothetical protein
MSELKSILEKSETKGLVVVDFVSKHRVVITIVVACAAVILAVFQAQSYLSPERNEEKYIEVKSSISTRKIDQEIVDKLSFAESDKENTADSNFVDDRTNPFAE